MTVTAYIGLGSNMGDRSDNLDRALDKLGRHSRITVVEASTIFETEPEGGPPGQDDYLNAVVEVKTDLSATELLHEILDIENQLGRTRNERHGPRIIDLDLLLFGDEVMNEPGLEVPHPRMHQRAFVLEPLAEIAPQVVHPKLGVAIARLWDEFDPDESSDEEPSASVPQVHSNSALLGKRALITGATGGIGRALALAFGSAGASVVIHGRNERAADQVATEIEALGVQTGILLADLDVPAQCREFVDTAWRDWGPIDVWINNAGVDTLTGAAAKWSFLDKLQALLELDVVATMLMSRDVGRRMREERSGLILNIGWDQAETGMEGDSGELFAAVKGAVMAFTKSLALSLAPNVRVNCLAPGWIRTAWGAGASPYWQQRVSNETPLGRWGAPEDVAAAALWLASPAANFITGQIIRINGGAVR